MSLDLPELRADITVTTQVNEPEAVLLLGVFSNEANPVLSPAAALFDTQNNGAITRAFKQGVFSGKPGQLLYLGQTQEWPAGVCAVGLGATENYCADVCQTVITKAFHSLRTWAPGIALNGDDFMPNDMQREAAARLMSGFMLNALTPRFSLKTEKAPVSKTEHVLWLDDEADQPLIDAVNQGAAVAYGRRFAQWLGDLPGNICTPAFIADAVVRACAGNDALDVTVLDKEAITRAGMGALLSVAKGSTVEPRFIAVRYTGAAADKAPVALIGKGVTFDAGGISLKPSANMADMIYDMSGAAAVIGTVLGAAKAKLPVNVLTVVGACENLPSGSATKPGDVVTSLSGKTIEVLNTDAEGRMVLADALTWAARQKPAVMIDVATLTGACVVALGDPYSGLFSADKPLVDALVHAGRSACDEVWPMPVGKAYLDLMKSNNADLANQASKRAGGASSAAAFLSVFTESLPWAHLDVAATANIDGRERISTGRPVGLLMQYLFDYE